MSNDDVCAEFARNFASLQIKYEELKAFHAESQQRCKTLTQKIEALTKDVADREQTIGELRHEKSELLLHRDRAAKATVAVEHLRGRLETQAKNFEDRELEHKHELAQLRAQLNDALTRVAHSSDHAAVAAVATQRVEIEERCAVVSSQLIEEKERAAQSQMAAVATVRDLSARNIELEQRMRALETELTSVRTRAQRASDTATEATLQRERVLLEKNAADAKAAMLARDVAQAHARLDERERAMELRVGEDRAAHERERDELQRLLADANGRVSELVAMRAQDSDRFAALQRAATAKLEAARAELEADLEAAAKAQHTAVEEAQRLKGRVHQERLEADEARAKLRHAEARVAALTNTLGATQAKLEATAQNEAWLVNERDRQASVAEQSQKRAEELAASLHKLQQRCDEGERLAMHLAEAQRDVEEGNEARERDQAAMRRVEQAYQAKLEAAKQDMKALKRRYTQALLKEERQKKLLLKALLEKEQAGSAGGNGAWPYAAMRLDDDAAAKTGAIDALALLRAQSEQARLFQERVRELNDPTARRSPSSSASGQQQQPSPDHHHPAPLGTTAVPL